MSRTRKSTPRRRAPQSLLAEMTALGIAAPDVIARRSLRIALSAGAPPKARDRREWSRMQREKFDAWNEAGRDIGLEWSRQQQRWLSDCLQAAWAPWCWYETLEAWQARWPADAERLLATGLAPARRRAEANARRLSRSRR